MAWPLSQDYNEALQNPRTSFGDPELRQGQVVTNALGLPLPCSGNFADVYAVECPASRTKWAVKCFTREVRGLRERYHEISNYLQQAHLPFTVDFQYLDQGIRIGGRWYPLLKMHWVEGYTLNAFVRDKLDKPATLDALGRIWLRMAQRLREAGLAHCDLQHGNVLLVPGSSAQSLAVKLIDYDGMWVPGLARTPSGEVGHPSYQHPLRLRNGTYNAEVDRFPLLVIATALHCLRVGGPALWERYDNGDNLLFREADLRAPAESPLFHELRRLNDPLARSLVEHLWRASLSPLEQAPLLQEVLPEEMLVPAAAGRGKAHAAHATASVATATRTATTNVFQDIELTAVGRRSRRYRSRRQGRSVFPWVVGGVLTASILLGVVLFAKTHSAAKGADKAAKKKKVAAQKPRELPKKVTPAQDAENKAKALEKARKLKREREKKLAREKERQKQKEREKQKPKSPVKAKPKPKVTPPKKETKPVVAPLPKRTIVNSLGMKLAYIPSGKFMMGSSLDEAKRLKREMKGYGSDKPESPRHEVRITRGFHMGIHEVTQAQYKQVMGKNPSRNKASPSHPVEGVTWPDAVEFCKKLSERPEEKKAGRVYRLPTEAEWEYACRAGSKGHWFFGNDLRKLGEYAWFAGNTGGRTHPVGMKKPNPWGLYDMYGNVWEFCLDAPRPYTPKAVSDPRGSQMSDVLHVLRGGSYVVPGRGCRSAFRKVRATDRYRTYHSGFRVVCQQPTSPGGSPP